MTDSPREHDQRTETGVCRPLEKRFRCPSCWQRRFYFKSNLDYHMQRKHGTSQQPGVCPECKGTGILYNDTRPVDCDVCEGTGQQPAQPPRLLAKHQPCGCIVCTCEDDLRCHGCGAKNCGTHPVGQIPNAVYEQPAQPGSGEVRTTNEDAANIGHALLEALRTAHPTYCWNDCPSEVVADLLNAVHDARAELTAAQQRVAELESELASLREQTRWRPMEEAPKDGTHVLAFFPDWQCTGEPRVMAVKWTGPPDSKHNCWWIPGYGGLSPELWREIGPLPGGDA